MPISCHFRDFWSQVWLVHSVSRAMSNIALYLYLLMRVDWLSCYCEWRVTNDHVSPSVTCVDCWCWHGVGTHSSSSSSPQLFRVQRTTTIKKTIAYGLGRCDRDTTGVPLSDEERWAVLVASYGPCGETTGERRQSLMPGEWKWMSLICCMRRA